MKKWTGYIVGSEVITSLIQNTQLPGDERGEDVKEEEKYIAEECAGVSRLLLNSLHKSTDSPGQHRNKRPTRRPVLSDLEAFMILEVQLAFGSHFFPPDLHD